MENKTIGIVGGGQLGKMLTNSAHKLGFKVIILDPTPNSPAGLVADEQIIGSFKDKEKILELGKKSDFITFEIESANFEGLEELVSKGKIVHPNPKILKIIKDKFEQKSFLKNHDIAVADFALITSIEDCKKQGEIFGYPFLLKARFDAYDGRGNFVVKEEGDIPLAFEKLSNRSPLYAEKFIPFTKELAVVSARDAFDNIESYPVIETVHQNNICHIVRSPAPVSDDVKEKANSLAEKVLKSIGGVGVFAVEMFLTKDNEVLVNEIAPRVHNSGHHTIEAFNASQFEQHIRAISGLHIMPLESKAKNAVMVNILGQRDGVAEYKITTDTEEDLKSAYVHIYGKIDTKIERKMGHITVLGDNLEDTESKAIKTRSNISI